MMHETLIFHKNFAHTYEITFFSYSSTNIIWL